MLQFEEQSDCGEISELYEVCNTNVSSVIVYCSIHVDGTGHYFSRVERRR